MHFWVFNRSPTRVTICAHRSRSSSSRSFERHGPGDGRPPRTAVLLHQPLVAGPRPPAPEPFLRQRRQRAERVVREFRGRVTVDKSSVQLGGPLPVFPGFGRPPEMEPGRCRGRLLGALVQHPAQGPLRFLEAPALRVVSRDSGSSCRSTSSMRPSDARINCSGGGFPGRRHHNIVEVYRPFRL